MSGTTAGGIPYVTPDDHPKEYPAASQQLAEKINSEFALIPPMCSGTLVGGIISAPTSFPIKFPPGMFTGPPLIQLSCFQDQLSLLVAKNSTANGSDVVVHPLPNVGSVIVRVAWFAVADTSYVPPTPLQADA